MNQTNKLVNKIKDIEIEQSNKNQKDEIKISKSQLTEDNLDEYLENVETDEHSKHLLNKYLERKSKK